MKRVGALWRGKEGSKSAFSGNLDLLGCDIRICIFPVKEKKDRGPDFDIVSYGINERKPDANNQTDNQSDLPF